MVSPDDEVTAAVVLAEDGVKQRFARAGVAHLHRVTRLDARAAHEVVLDQRIDRADAHVGRDVSGFQLAEQLMDQ